MTIRHFRIFAAVCDDMNMTRAAEKLFISQSAISQAISELESHYGTKLFERLSKKLYLTSAGEKLLGYSKHIIKMAQEAEDKLRDMADKGLIRIGASVTVGANILPELVCNYKSLSPETEIHVVENNTEIIEKMLLNNDIDVALVEGEISSSDIISKPFLEDELVLISGKTHEFAGRDAVSPEELKRNDYIVRERGSGTRNLFENVMAVNNIKWNYLWVCNNADTIKNAVIKGIGISAISMRSVTDEVKSGDLFVSRVVGIEFKRHFKIIYHKNKYITSQLEKFIRYCNAFNG